MQRTLKDDFGNEINADETAFIPKVIPKDNIVREFAISNIFEESEKELKDRDVKKQIREISDRISDVEVLISDIQKSLKRFEKQIEKLKKKKGEE